MSTRAPITGLSGDTRAALTDTLPVGAGMIPLLMLVAYLLRDVPSQAPAAAAVTVAAALGVAVLHLWRSNALLSIFTGTAAYVLATNLLVH